MKGLPHVAAAPRSISHGNHIPRHPRIDGPRVAHWRENLEGGFEMSFQTDWDFDAVFHAILEDICREQGKRILRIEETAAHFLEEVDWDDDFENFRRILAEAVHSAEHGVIGVRDLPLGWVRNRRPKISKNDSSHRLRIC